MWQRIQTLYLAISLALTAVLLFGTAYTLTSPEGLVRVKYLALQRPWFGILLGIQAFGQALALVVFRSRILQMRLSVLFAIVALGMQAWLAWMYFSFEGPVFSWTAVLPFVITVLDFLAARGCFQDQLMVESAYRIRERRKRKRR
ncbi:MAG: DUF4293 family protein [Bacteroidales bacterium]|nr:DUF4293 family protein [Bacteroidales bacterium]MBP5373862.1 DUF4293 family protein [Bacteroidales bacterium]